MGGRGYPQLSLGSWLPGIVSFLLAWATAGNSKDTLKEGTCDAGAILNSQDLTCHMVEANEERGNARNVCVFSCPHSHAEQNEVRPKRNWTVSFRKLCFST